MENSYEAIYESIIEILQKSDGRSDIKSLTKTVLVEHPNQEPKIKELIWYLISQQKLTYKAPNIVSLTKAKHH